MYTWIYDIIFIIIATLIAYLVILTKYEINHDKLNKLLIFILYIVWISMPFWSLSQLITITSILSDNQGPLLLLLNILLLFDLIICVYSIINLVQTIKFNASATNSSNATPITLLKTGYYQKVRHPMFGGIALFFLTWNILWGSIAGLIAMGIWMLLFFNDARKEENQQLIPKFGQEYLDYKKVTPYMFLSMKEKILAWIILGAWGILQIILYLS